MKISDLPFAVLRFQYRLARFPFEFIEQRVVARMDSEAPGRLLYERSLATVDVTVGSLLGASELEERGATLAEGPYEQVSRNPAVIEAYMGSANVELKGAH